MNGQIRGANGRGVHIDAIDQAIIHFTLMTNCLAIFTRMGYYSAWRRRPVQSFWPPSFAQSESLVVIHNPLGVVYPRSFLPDSADGKSSRDRGDAGLLAGEGRQVGNSSSNLLSVSFCRLLPSASIT